MPTMNKPNEYTCTRCGEKWIGAAQCPNGCTSKAESGGEYTQKTFQGNDTDLRKSGR